MYRLVVSLSFSDFLAQTSVISDACSVAQINALAARLVSCLAPRHMNAHFHPNQRCETLGGSALCLLDATDALAEYNATHSHSRARAEVGWGEGEVH